MQARHSVVIVPADADCDSTGAWICHKVQRRCDALMLGSVGLPAHRLQGPEKSGHCVNLRAPRKRNLCYQRNLQGVSHSVADS